MLEVHGLNVGYGVTQVLFDISLQVQAREIVALLGSNGAGKSTLMKAVSGMLRPLSGEVRFDGQAMGGASPQAVVGAGLVHVPEGRRIFPGLTVLENLEMGSTAWRGMSRRNFAEDLERVFTLFPRLKERSAQLGYSLSGGEQQMLAVARGLMARPKLLMLDEPSVGLAPMIVDQVFDVIATIAEQGVTVLLVEQNAVRALELASRGYVIQGGRMVLEGDAQRLLADSSIQEAYLGKRG